MKLICVNTRNKRAMKALLYLAALVGLITSTAMSTIMCCVVVVCLYVFTGGWKFLYIVYRTAGRDLKSLIRFKKTQLYLALMRRRKETVPKLFHKLALTHPNRVLFYFEDEEWTFKDVDEFSNRVANYFLEMGFHAGEEVALFMENRPEFVGIWLGLAKAGIVTALINTNLRLDTLIHSITVIDSRALIYGSELSNAVKEVMPKLSSKRPIQYFSYGKLDSNMNGVKSLKLLLRDVSSEVPSNMSKGNFTDRLLYIYTSGTTGLPKAAIIKNSRYIWMGAAVKNMIKLGNNEVIYTSLPLYHLAGGVLGTCLCLVFGNSMAIRNKFSASNFWKDCIKYKCTIAQYIGEICRYLLAQPSQSTDAQHCVRVMFGNGLRPQIWPQFVTRFNIKQIGELYGSTEGNANMINVDNREGSCGFISQIAGFLYPAALVKVNEKTGEYVRDENGICVMAKPYETGEFVGKIIDSDPTRSFDGYANREATKKKIIYDVFNRGDRAFASGDMLTIDEFGYLYFKDRLGDTFRWKGENVSTMEVESMISNILHLTDCIVYGVEVPNCEGKAGMVAILYQNNCLDLDQFLHDMKRSMPLFAIPVFVRIAENLESTGTFKLPKNTFQKECYNPSIVSDPLFVLDIKNSKYVRIDEKVYNDIQMGTIKL